MNTSTRRNLVTRLFTLIPFVAGACSDAGEPDSSEAGSGASAGTDSGPTGGSGTGDDGTGDDPTTGAGTGSGGGSGPDDGTGTGSGSGADTDTGTVTTGGSDSDSGSGSGSDSDSGSGIDCPNVGGAAEGVVDIMVDGVERQYALFVSESAVQAMGDGPVPLMFWFHGAGGEGWESATERRLPELAERNGAVLAAPSSVGTWWLNGEMVPNDLELILEVVDQVSGEYCIDQKRIYSAGHSNGGGFVSGQMGFTGLELGSGRTWDPPFAAYLVHAGFLERAVADVDFSAIEPKRPVWVIHGTSDGAVSFEAGEALYETLDRAGWDATFTRIDGAGHVWLFSGSWGYSDQELWDWYMDNPIP